MKIYDQTKTRILSEEECNKELGYFVEEELVIGQRPSLIETISNPDGSQSTTKYDTLEIKERVLVYVPFTEKQKAEREIDLLERWFETEYREQFEKCTRKIKLGLMMRDGSDPQVILNNLYAEAESKSARINQLKQVM